MTASLLGSPGLFLVFEQISTMLWSVSPQFFLWFPIPTVSFPVLWGIVLINITVMFHRFFRTLASFNICLYFRLLSFSFCAYLEQQNSQDNNNNNNNNNNMQEVKIWSNEQMVYVQPKIHPGDRDAQNSLGFWNTNGTSNLGQTTKPSDSKKKKKKRKKEKKKKETWTGRIVDFVVSTDHWGKLKESEKKDKYLDLARELKKLWNMKVTMRPIVIGALGSHQRFGRGLEDLEIRRQVEPTGGLRWNPCDSKSLQIYRTFKYSSWFTIMIVRVFHTSALTGRRSLESEWKQISSGLQNSSQYSSRSYQHFGLYNLDSFSAFCSFGEMWTISSLPLFPGPLWPGLVILIRVPSLYQIELFNHLTICK